MGESDENPQRILRAQTVLDVYGQLAGQDDDEGMLTDLMTDLRHYVAANRLDWDRLERVSLMHFVAESDD